MSQPDGMRVHRRLLHLASILMRIPCMLGSLQGSYLYHLGWRENALQDSRYEIRERAFSCCRIDQSFSRGSSWGCWIQPFRSYHLTPADPPNSFGCRQVCALLRCELWPRPSWWLELSLTFVQTTFVIVFLIGKSLSSFLDKSFCWFA